MDRGTGLNALEKRNCPCYELNHDSSVVQPALRLVTISSELAQLQYVNVSQKKDRLYVYNLTLRRLRVTLVAVEKQYVLNILSVYLFLLYFVVPYVYLLYYVCVAVLYLDAGLLARSQYPEGPANGHLDTGFLGFPVSTSEC